MGEQLKEDFSKFAWQIFKEKKVDLHEGVFHCGAAWVLELKGTKERW